MSNLEKAKRILQSSEYTCVLCKEEDIRTSTERGVKPLLAWYESNGSFPCYCAADKVVGNGAAFLYVLLGVSAVYADVISLPALALLQSYGIRVEYATKTEHIINRRGDGICPFEVAVMEIDDAQTAYCVIREKMKELNIL